MTQIFSLSDSMSNSSISFSYLNSSLDAYLNEMQQEQGQNPQFDYGDGGGGGFDLMGLAAAPIDPAHHMLDDRGEEGGDEPSSGVVAASVYSEMSVVLMHREKEFLGFLCQPLENLEENVAESCIEALADELRAKVSNQVFAPFHMFYLTS